MSFSGTPPTTFRFFAGAILALVGAGVLLVGASVRTEASLRRLGGVSPVNQGALDSRDIRAHNSPTVVSNPKNPANLVVANRVDTPAFSCALHVSFDAGSTWKESMLPMPAEEPKCFGADVAFDRDGTLYMSFVILAGPGNIPNGVWTMSSRDGGRTFSAPRRAFGPGAYNLRLAADTFESGRLYLVWVQVSDVGNFGFVNPGNPVSLARSDDGGDTWQGPVRVSSSVRERVVAPSIAVGPKGELYAAYLDLNDDRLDYHGEHEGRGGEPFGGSFQLVVARSTDLGASWRETVAETRLAPSQRFLVFFPPSPSIAVDPSGKSVFAAFHDGRSGDPNVRLWISRNAGKTFSPGDSPYKDSPAARGAQYLPKIQTAPNGRLDIVYFDRTDRANRRNNVSFQSSFDRGVTFTPRLRLSDRSFDARIGFGSERGMPELGSRLGLLSTEGGALAVWPDTRGGTQASNKQDLARAAVRVLPPQQIAYLRVPVQVTGALLIVAGVSILAAGALSSRKH